jgi:tRNA-binding protein
VVVPGTRSYRVGRIIRDSPCIPEEASVSSSRVPAEPPFLEPGSATVDDLVRLDLRIGRIVEADLLEGARRPAYRLLVDFGAAGTRRSSAQLAGTYPDPAALVGRLVVAVVNLPPRRVAGFSSEVLVLGALAPDGRIPLLGVDEGAEPGQRVA